MKLVFVILIFYVQFVSVYSQENHVHPLISAENVNGIWEGHIGTRVFILDISTPKQAILCMTINKKSCLYTLNKMSFDSGNIMMSFSALQDSKAETATITGHGVSGLNCNEHAHFFEGKIDGRITINRINNLKRSWDISFTKNSKTNSIKRLNLNLIEAHKAINEAKQK